LLSLTAAPVTMIPAFTTTPASARVRMDRRVGRQKNAVSRAAALVRAGDPPLPPAALASPAGLTLVATCSS
jgi:hypothetical protein